MAPPRKEGSRKRTYMLSDELIDRLTAVANAEGRTVTAQMERFLWEKVREYEKVSEKQPGNSAPVLLAA